MWRTLRRLIVETGEYQIQAMGELERCNSIAVEMQRYRASSFRLLEQISQESTDWGVQGASQAGAKPVLPMGRAAGAHSHNSQPEPGARGLGSDRRLAGDDLGYAEVESGEKSH